MSEINDKEFIFKYLNGDEKSLEILIGKYLKPIYNFTYHYLGNAVDAEDVTQEVFVKVWRNIKKFNQEKNFKSWIFSIARNASIDFLRKTRSAGGGKKTLPFSFFESDDGGNIITDTLIDPAPLPPEILERADLADLLAAAMEKLSAKYREVLFLHHNDHFTFQEIADALGEPLNTVKSRYRRALIILKESLAKIS